MTDLPKLTYTLAGAAQALNISKPTMLKIVNRADFPSFRAGRRWIIPAEGLKSWIATQASSAMEDRAQENRIHPFGKM